MRIYVCLSIIWLCASCAEPPMTAVIEFAAEFSGEPLACDTGAGGPAMTDLRFFVHAIELQNASGTWQSLQLTGDGSWQQGDLAMLDIEDGSGECPNGTTETNAVVTGTLPNGNYQGLRFVLGVPFDRNHADPLTALAPLDDSAMHWHWRSGYKFLRAGLATETDGFWIHLGSTGCEGTVGNITACRQPNRVRVDLADFVPGEDTVVFDFSALLQGTDLDDGDTSDCSSAPSEASCRDPFAAFGLKFGTGQVLSAQRVFRLADR